MIEFLGSYSTAFTAHFELHEMTNTGSTEFRPDLATATHDNWDIPDGFYTAGNTDNPANDFQTAIILFGGKGYPNRTAKYFTTAEVYPDSPKVDNENCSITQVVAITGGLEYKLSW